MFNEDIFKDVRNKKELKRRLVFLFFFSFLRIFDYFSPTLRGKSKSIYP